MKRILSVMAFLAVFCFLSFSQGIELTSINATWRTVLPGKVISRPVQTSYGFAAITDAKSIMAFSDTGSFIWEKKLYKPTQAFFSVLPGDFIAAITNGGTHISLLNPDGSELWYSDTDIKITKTPVAGRDGRFFLCADTAVICYGMNGVRKWTLQTPEQGRFGIEQLPDGSLVVFLRQLADKKTCALRVSPFGELLEQITFSGEVVTALTTPKGILLTFTDGTSGLFALEDNAAAHKWIFQKNKLSKTNTDFFVLSQNKEDVIYINLLSDSLQIDYINLDDGSISNSFVIPGIRDTVAAYYNSSGVLVADLNKAYFYNNFGRYIWEGKMPSTKSREFYDYLMFTPNNDFVLFGRNWSANAFRTSKNAVEQKHAKTRRERANYSDFYTVNTAPYTATGLTKLNEQLVSEERHLALENGDYGKAEAEWISQLLSACRQNKNIKSTSNFGSRIEKSVFEVDTAGVEKMYAQAGLYGTDTFVEYIAYFIKHEKNSALLKQILSAARECGYDPDLEILDALAYLASSMTARDELIILDICDTVYEICRFMGYAAIEPKGRQILSEFMYPQYQSTTRTYARKTLEKFRK